MATAYSALVSLIHVLNRVQHPTCPATFDKWQIQSLFNKVSELVDFLEAYSPSISKDLERKITDAAYAAQDEIESYVVDRIHERGTGNIPDRLSCGVLASIDYGFLHHDLERAIQGVDIIIQETMEVKHKREERPSIEQKRNKRPAIKRVDQIRERLAFLRHYPKKAIERVDRIIQKTMKLKQSKSENQQPSSTVKFGSPVPPVGTIEVLGFRDELNGSTVPPTGTIEILGFRDELNVLLERLATDQPSRETLPVVGMGGIGKSTLARSVYNHPYIQDTFDVKAWVTISQVYDIGRIIRLLLDEFGILGIKDEQLGNRLHKNLFGRKYLIILDDIWDSRAWDEISRFLPDNNNGSRILLTTRLSNVALSVGSCSPYEMKLLDDNRSWDLLSKMVFGQDGCPGSLEQCGKVIAKSCKGLPLAIVVIVGVLKMSSTLEYWEDVEKNISSIISRQEDEHCFKILYLSYQELPIHLKPCFLYMATFPEDHKIRVSEVTMLWAADGFLKPNGVDTLEEVALENIKDLINRNLIMVNKLDSRGCIKCLSVHDLVRDLCLREAETERFLYMDGGVGANLSHAHRFVLHHSGRVFSRKARQERLARSFISFMELTSPPPLLGLLRVFSAAYQGSTPHDITQLANLRYINSADYDLFIFLDRHTDRAKSFIRPISLLWNLETLIVTVPNKGHHSVPREIWELQHIKHIIFSGKVIFPDPPTGQTDSILSNLQTLRNVIVLSNKVLYRIPNIRSLWIKCEVHGVLSHGFWNLVHCHKLETLNLDGRIRFAGDGLNTVKLFPDYLKKLTLSNCRIPWGRMVIVGSLPNLELLKLEEGAFIGNEWNSNEEEFQSLKSLSISRCNLKAWRVDGIFHFPCLEYLRLRNMSYLEEVPQVFGESTTLKSIWLEYCKISVVISAKQILVEQESMGYDDLTVEILYPMSTNVEQLKELENSTSDRFHVQLRKW